MAESTRRYNLRNTKKKPQGVLLKRWEVEYSKLVKAENRRIPLETIRFAIRSAFENSGIEQWRITLKCPLSQQQIRVPARYVDCTHIECFDLETFLQMKMKKNFLVCPICQKQVEKPMANLRIDEYIETVLSELPDALQVELMPDGTFTNVQELVIAPHVIDDEEPFVQDNNAPATNKDPKREVKQEEDDYDYIMLSDGEDEFMEEVSIVDMKPIYLIPLNMDIKPNIALEPELSHSREEQETQKTDCLIQPLSSSESVVVLTKREPPESVSTVPVGLRVLATLGSIVSIDVDSKPIIASSTELELIVDMQVDMQTHFLADQNDQVEEIYAEQIENQNESRNQSADFILLDTLVRRLKSITEEIQQKQFSLQELVGNLK